MKSSFENIMRIVVIAILLALCATGIGIASMFISVVVNPKSPIVIFGMRAYNIQEEDEFVEGYSSTSFDVVKVSTNRIPVSFFSHENNNVRITYRISSFGLGQANDNLGFKKELVSEEIDGENKNVLYITINEPVGWITSGTSSLTIGMPNDFDGKDVYFTTNSSIINVSDSTNSLNINKLFYTGKDGQLNLGIGGLNSLNASTDKANVTIENNIGGAVNFNSTIGKLVCKNVGSLTVNTRNAYVRCENSGAINITSTNGSCEAKEVYGNVTLAGPVKFKSTKLVGNLTTTNGGSAEINVSEFNGNADIKSNSGFVTLNYSDDASISAKLLFSSKNGTFTVGNFKGNLTTNIEGGGTCSMDISFNIVFGVSTINAQKGSVNLKLPNQAVIINAKSSSSTDINAYSTSSNQNETGDLLINGATASSINKINIVTSSGRITIREK